MSWYPKMYINDLVLMKERLLALEKKSRMENIKVREISESNWKLTKEVNILREQV